MKRGPVAHSTREPTNPPKENSEEINPLSAEEVYRLVGAARHDQLDALYVFPIHTGMGQGELLALKWDDIELKNGVVNLRRTPTKQRQASLRSTQAGRGRRRVDLTDALEALRDHLGRQANDPPRLGGLYQDQGPVLRPTPEHP